MSRPTDAMTRADPVALTQQLVRTPSVNPVLEEGGDGEGAVAELAAEWLDAWGYRPATVEVAPGRYNVVARRGGGAGPSLLLNGHLD
ncbi:MAG: acetylornithine deacetylase, partial [Gemmatimonadetes bacterium]|nr:acetylornithine deacetylase [Gemmatimonadota bacterium]